MRVSGTSRVDKIMLMELSSDGTPAWKCEASGSLHSAAISEQVSEKM